MEVLNEIPKFRRLFFKGEGSEYFVILIVNALLTIITLGFYYPWARARTLSYVYSNTELEGSRFTFHGTGKQMFFGFIKAIALFLLIYSVLMYGQISNSIFFRLIGLLVFYIGTLILIPMAYHGGLRYRLAKTSWRKIHFGYRGERSQLMKIFIPGTILTTITLGIYSSWLKTDLRKYIIGNIRFGNVSFNYTGIAQDLFWINFKGIVLSIFSLGLYLFWYAKNWIAFYLNSLEVVQNNVAYCVKADIKTWEFILFQVINFFLLSVTFGLANAWVRVRTFEFFFDRIEIPVEINLDIIEQTESDYSDATGDDFIGMMDMGVV